MAIYYITVQIIGRSAGRTATGAAAYRAGERIYDERTGRTFDYTRRTGEIETEILTPEGAPDWAHDREQLWNHVEAAEKRGDAQVAREIVVAIPKELSAGEQRELVREYVRDQFVSRGMAADVAIHRNPGNPHAHITLTMRELGPDGLAMKKNREWNRPEMLERWREEWANHANRALERAGREERIDHRSLEEQGLDRLPQVHLGPHSAALERQGTQTEKGDHNRQVAEHNAVVIDLEKARVEKEALEAERVAQDRFDGRVRSGWLPDQAHAMAQLEAASGGRELTMPDLEEQRMALCDQRSGIRAEIREIDQEGEKLEFARRALEDHRTAQEQLRRHMTPFAGIKRVFSAPAQQAYRDAQEYARWTGGRVEGWGVKSEPEWQTRKGLWELKRAKVPGMEGKVSGIEGTIKLIDEALKGFGRAMAQQREAREREAQGRNDSILRQLRQNVERNRDRGLDRGR